MQVQKGYICLPSLCLHYVELNKRIVCTKDRPPHYGLHPPYAAVCFFPRQAGRPDKGNYLESGDAISDKKQKTLAISVIF